MREKWEWNTNTNALWVKVRDFHAEGDVRDINGMHLVAPNTAWHPCQAEANEWQYCHKPDYFGQMTICLRYALFLTPRNKNSFTYIPPWRLLHTKNKRQVPPLAQRSINHISSLWNDELTCHQAFNSKMESGVPACDIISDRHATASNSRIGD